MKLSAERKRVVFLGGILALLGGYSLYTNVLSGPSSPEPERPGRAGASSSPAPGAPGPRPDTVRPRAPSRTSAEFRPSLKPKRPEERVDPRSIDPTLRLDLLAKVQAVDMQGAGRNLFQFSTAPPPPLPPEPKIKKPVTLAADAQPGPPAPPAAPPKPQAPPITLKYYGYATASGAAKHAFFLDGDDILVAAEGDLLKKRYRVVRIGVNSVVMEDTQFKHEQTLPLQAEAAA